MDKDAFDEIGRQLRRPHGEMAKEIGERMNVSNRVMNEHTFAVLLPKEGDRILELGMGNGFFVPQVLALASNLSYIGCDYSEEMVDEAFLKNKEAVASGVASFFHADVEKMPFESRTFDIVFTVNTVYFWDDPAIALGEIRRVLKTDGKLVLAFRPKLSVAGLPFTREGFTLYTEEELTQCLESNSFVVEDFIRIEEEAQNVMGNMLPVTTCIVTARPQ